MKVKILLLSVFLSLVYISTSAQKPIYTQSKVEAVKVYRNIAELSNKVRFSIPAGTSEVVIGNISDKIEEKTIQYSLV